MKKPSGWVEKAGGLGSWGWSYSVFRVVLGILRLLLCLRPLYEGDTEYGNTQALDYLLGRGV